MLILLGDCLTLWLMFYGLVFSGEDKLSVRNQRAGIIVFATKHNWPIDKFIVLDKNLDFSEIKPGDTVICYAWNCLCHRWALLQKFIMFALEHGIYVYSVTSNYCIDETMDMKTLKYAFGMYQDMRFNFISGKNTAGARQRVLNGHAPGRPHGARNIRHVIDGKEDIALKMYKNGASMYAIAKKIGVSGPTVKRFLASQG